MAADYTPRQGQHLAFIYYYTQIHGLPPAEADMQRYSRVSPPAVHEMAWPWNAMASSPESRANLARSDSS